MNKRTMQAFALGILFSAISLWAGSGAVADKEDQNKEVSVTDAKSALEGKGYKVLTTEAFATLNEKKKEEEKTESKASEDQTKKEEVKQENTFTLVIASGMTPGDVAVMLKSQGIIDDEKKFERFLIDKGYHTKVQIGRYDLTDSMDYVQIAKIITKNK